MIAPLKEIGVGIIGFGTVGAGTAKLLIDNAELLRRRVGVPVVLRWVADTDLTRDRGVSLPEGMLTDDAMKVINDPSVQIIVELIGGTKVARDFILAALSAGKAVVTANKALLAEHGAEIAKAAQVAGVDLCFEASVGDGIPIIRSMREGLSANRIEAIYGIINGTCNYILSKMTSEGRDYADILAEAQSAGLAEADPSFDVDGIDTAHKLSILVWLATGRRVSPKDISIEGIRDVSAADIAFATKFGYVIKLLAIAKERGESYEVRVHPTMIPKRYLLAQVDGAFNAVYVKGDFVGPTMSYGQGAGRLPTASAVGSDIIEAARNLRKGAAGRIPPSGFFLNDADEPIAVAPSDHAKSEYYLRFRVVDKPGVLSKIAGILGEHRISISSVLQTSRDEESSVPIDIVTHLAREKDMKAALAETDRLPVVVDRTRMIRIENDL